MIFSLMLLMFLFGSVSVYAQVDTEPVTVTIDLSTSVISISLESDPHVTFSYESAQDYTEEKKVEKPSHFTVISNLPYDVSVKAESEFSSTGTENPDLNVVTIKVDENTANGGNLSAVTLSTSPGELVKNADPSTGATYNVEYSIPSAETLIELDNVVYTTTVTYTATHL